MCTEALTGECFLEIGIPEYTESSNGAYGYAYYLVKLYYSVNLTFIPPEYHHIMSTKCNH